MADPPSYEAIRGASFTYVESEDGAPEFYDLVRDPDELDNRAPTLPR